MSRSARVTAMVDDSIKRELETIAAGMGLTLSGLAAYVLGQYVWQQREVVRPMLGRIQSAVVQAVSSVVTTEQAPPERSEGKP